MTLSKTILLSAVSVLFLASCDKADESYGSVPELKYTGVSNRNIYLNIDSSDWIMYYDFVDGNGDLGTQVSEDSLQVFVTNETTGTLYKFPFPYVSESSRGGKDYIKGNGKVILSIPMFMQVRTTPLDRERDTFVFSLYVKDDAGNQSNTIKSDAIIVNKQ